MLNIAQQAAARRPIINDLTRNVFQHCSVPAGCAYLTGIVTPTVAGGLFALPAPAAACDCCECPECDARVDRWHDGYFAHRAGKPCPTDKDAADGWHHRRKNLPWEATDVVERPEGYYHAPLGTFE